MADIHCNQTLNLLREINTTRAVKCTKSNAEIQREIQGTTAHCKLFDENRLSAGIHTGWCAITAALTASHGNPSVFITNVNTVLSINTAYCLIKDASSGTTDNKQCALENLHRRHQCCKLAPNSGSIRVR